jgi:hypothetical protein
MSGRGEARRQEGRHREEVAPRQREESNRFLCILSSHSAPQSRGAAFDTDIARHVLPAVGDPSTIPYRVAPPIKRRGFYLLSGALGGTVAGMVAGCSWRDNL